MPAPRVVTLITILVLCACGRDTRRPPRTEFLVFAGDSTFWVRPEQARLRVRGSPIQLARVGERLVELYVTDDDRSFRGALLVGQRIYRRDLITGDSSIVFDDTTITSVARWYAHEHPDDRPLRPEEETDVEPHVDVLGEVVTVDQHGPFLSFEYRVDGVLEGTNEMHEVRRGVVDLRDGSSATLPELFGDSVAAVLAAEGARRFTRTLDSVLASSDQRARDAISALPDMSFDARSFTLSALAREPAVEFAAVGTGPRAGGIILPLEPIRAPAPDWWADVRQALPETSADSMTERWSRGDLTVEARYDSIGDRATLVLRRTPPPGEWRLASLPSPARRLYWFDGAPDSASRRALTRAFDEAALYSEGTRTASRARAHRAEARFARDRRSPRWLGRLTSHTIDRAITPRPPIQP